MPQAGKEIPGESDAVLAAAFPGIPFGAGVQVLGTREIQIGSGSCVGDGSWLNVCVRDGKIRMRIGESVLVGRRATLSTAGKLEIGSFCLLAPNVYVSDADHLYRDWTLPLYLSGVTEGREVLVEENCWLGTNCVITGNTTVGRGSVVGANSVVTHDVPPFSVAVGIPARVVKMYDPILKLWEKVEGPDDVERILLRREKSPLPSRAEYLEILRRKGVPAIDPILAGRGMHLP